VANYRGDVQRSIDAGVFSPNVKFSARSAMSAAMRMSDAGHSCVVRAVRFVDGAIRRQ